MVCQHLDRSSQGKSTKHFGIGNLKGFGWEEMNSLYLALASAGCIFGSFILRPIAAPLLMGGVVSGVMAEQRRKLEVEYLIPLKQLERAAWLDQQEQQIGFMAAQNDLQMELEHEQHSATIQSLIGTLEQKILPVQPAIDVPAQKVERQHVLAVQQQERITIEGQLESQFGNSSELFEKFLKQPHNWVCGKTNGGKTFLLLRLVKDWIAANPSGRVYVLDRNFGKPDRVTGEVFDWNGLPQSIIYSKDEEIITVLQKMNADLEKTIGGFDQFARKLSNVRPELINTLIVVTEWNALVDNSKAGKDPKTSPAVEAMRPILQQGNGYKFKAVLDGQNIAVGESGISEALREQISICLVGSTSCDLGIVGELGGTNKQKEKIVEECTALRKAGKRACVIQLGEGEPVVGVVPEMPWLRNFRFDADTVTQAPLSVKVEADDSTDSTTPSLNAIFDLLPDDPTDADIIKAYEAISRSPAPYDLTERNNLIRYIRDRFNDGKK